MKSGGRRRHPPASIARGPPCPPPRGLRQIGDAGSLVGDLTAGVAMSKLRRASEPVENASGCATEIRFPAAIALSGSRRERAALAAAFPEADAGSPEAVAVWSASWRRRPALLRAKALGVPALLLTPGLLRAPPGWGKPPLLLSITASAIEGLGSSVGGLYPDHLLMSRGWEAPALLDRAAVARRSLTEARVGGAWWNAGAVPDADGLALVVANEASPFCPPAVLEAMLEAALADNRAQKVVLLASARSCPRTILQAAAAFGCVVVDGPVDPWAVIARARRVYCGGGETGFLALIAGSEVRCFGHSFYSGWGVTVDAAGVPQKPFRRTVEQIFAGACLLATRYLDPYRNVPATFEDIVTILTEWRRVEAASRRIAVCLGMSWWKRRWIAEFFRSGSRPPRFRRNPRAALAVAAARPGSAIAVWASRMPPGLAASAARQGTSLVTVEDGFIRSVGLGSDFIRAASLALDASGAHCDPDVCSDLERLLRDTDFDPAVLRRARDLIAALVACGITKYNLNKYDLRRKGMRPNRLVLRGQLFDFPPGRRRILVPGQVEDDLSVRLGGGAIRRNIELLACVRAGNPDAFILYKPHPDVEAGHRRGSIPRTLATKFADAVIAGGSTGAILGGIDELHTLTSLTGFEALLRRRKVVVYGRPFYAGWGLTRDCVVIERGRHLTLEELVAGALILYPWYLDPVTRLPCPPEIIVDRLAQPELWRTGPLVAARQLHGLIERQWDRLAAPMHRFAGEPR